MRYFDTDPETAADMIQAERAYFDDFEDDDMFPDQSDQHNINCSCRECMQSYEQAESERRHFSFDGWSL